MSDVELFKTAPAEVTRYFGAKRSIPSFDWRDIAPEEHAFSWTVAKSAGFDVLDDIRAAVDNAITNRVPFEAFRDQLTPILQAKGWWGRKIATDPQTGDPMVVQLGSPRRLRTIYWANTMTAHAAGEWERVQRNKAFLPFLVYTLSQAERRREEHEAWVGIVLPVDDPFWQTHYPPNGWLCQCGIRQIGRAEAARLGYRDDQQTPIIMTRRWLNKRTGEWENVPEGIDPGWGGNAGLARGVNVSSFLYDQMDAMPDHRRSAAIADIVGSPVMSAMASGKAHPDMFMPVAQLPQPMQAAFGAKTRLLRLSAHSVQHIIHDHPDRLLSVPDLRAALQVAQNPAAIIRSNRVNSDSAILLGVANGAWWRVVVKATNEGREWWLTSFHRRPEARAAAAIRNAIDAGKLIK